MPVIQILTVLALSVVVLAKSNSTMWDNAAFDNLNLLESFSASTAWKIEIDESQNFKSSARHTTNMTSFVILRHPVTTLVTAFNNPDKMTNDLLILKTLWQYTSLT